MPTTAPRAFRRAAAKSAERSVTAFTLDWVDDEDEEKVYRSDTFHATKPSDEQLFLVAAMIGDEDHLGSEATAVLDIFRDALPFDEFLTLKKRLVDPEDSVDMDTIAEVLEWLMEAWSDFPTGPSSASSQSQTPTGTKSTGRVRGTGSTRSPSPSRGS